MKFIVIAASLALTTLSAISADVEERLKRYSNKTEEFLKQMEDFWSSSKGNNNCFWSHEWNKHGTCISNLDPSCTSNPVKGKDIYSYFSKGLELRAKYDLFKALAEERIFPSQTRRFSTKNIRNAIKAKFDVDPGLYCQNGNLQEVWLYFKVKNGDQYVPVQPPTHRGLMGNCRKMLSYPPKY
ncbi:Ribonuclease T2 precursor (RNase T2) [Mortierella antarctica]|nr:Ribonuclease T2 precursor (RNase T2) [Mortierella antarctica]